MLRLILCKCSVLCMSCIVFIPLPAQGIMCKSYTACVHYSHRSVLCKSCLCMHYCQRSVLRECCFLCAHYCQCSVLCKSCSVFALLPAQCVVYCKYCLCMHYCQHSVLRKCCFLCVHYCQRSVLLLSIASAVYRAGATISPHFSIIFNYLLFLPIPTSWEWMSTGSPIITTSKSCLSCYAS